MKKTHNRSIAPLACCIFRIIAFLTIFTVGSSEGADGTKHELVESPNAAKLRQVRVSISVKGELRLNPNGSEIRKMPVQVKGDLYYEEQRFANNPALRAKRYYHQAQADIEIGTFKINPAIADAHRIVAVGGEDENRPILFSPAGPLTREELELIDIQGNSVLLDQMLPQEAVAVGDKWQVPDTSLVPLLNLEGISSAEVSAQLTEVEDNVAVVAMEGSVSGAVGGISTEIDLKAKYNFDFKLKQITWFALAIHEKRAIGHAEPGLDVIAQIRMALRPIRQSQHLSSNKVAVPSKEDVSTNALLSCVSNDGGYRMLYDRRWKIMSDGPHVTVLRFVDRGDLVAQGNISRLADQPAGEHLALEAFQADVQKALGESFGQFVQASQSRNENGIRVLKVMAAGQAADLPIHWIYYHLADDEGRRASLVFTLEQELVEQFASADAVLVTSLEFLAQAKQAPTPADPAAATSQRPNSAQESPRKR